MIFIFLSVTCQSLSLIGIYLLSKNQDIIYEIFLNPFYYIVLILFFIRGISYMVALEKNKLLIVYFFHALVPLIIFLFNIYYLNYFYSFYNLSGIILIIIGILFLWKK